MPYLLFIPSLGIAAAAVVFGVRQLKYVEYVKALFSLSLLVIAVYAFFSGARPLFAGGVALGLLFCVAADYLLGKPDNSGVFIFGLLGFLFGYLVYGGIFHIHGAWTPVSTGAAVLLAAGAAVQYKTFRKLEPSLRVPVLVYIAVLSVMLLGGLNFARHPETSAVRAALVSAGALLIYISDSLIAHNLFRRPIGNSDLYILPPYYLGQIFITLSLFMG